jgi:hypothetical protein
MAIRGEEEGSVDAHIEGRVDDLCIAAILDPAAHRAVVGVESGISRGGAAGDDSSDSVRCLRVSMSLHDLSTDCKRFRRIPEQS